MDEVVASTNKGVSSLVANSDDGDALTVRVLASFLLEILVAGLKPEVEERKNGERERIDVAIDSFISVVVS